MDATTITTAKSCRRRTRTCTNPGIGNGDDDNNDNYYNEATQAASAQNDDDENKKYNVILQGKMFPKTTAKATTNVINDKSFSLPLLVLSFLMAMCFQQNRVSAFSTVLQQQRSKALFPSPSASANDAGRFQPYSAADSKLNVATTGSENNINGASSTSASSFSSTVDNDTNGNSGGNGGSSSGDSEPITRPRAVVGNWEELHGNFLLRPSVEAGAPRALIHFLGGAIVGAAPHVSYRYFLECLADQGYLVVATPYSLSFDHLATCDATIARFERIAPLLARTYGPLPVVGVGHSCGALLQVLITSLFPDTPRAANALISFNNKPVSEAVPFFEELWAPFFTYAAAKDDDTRNSGSEIITTGLRLMKASVQGEVPSDELLSKAFSLLTPPGVLSSLDNEKSITVPESLRSAFSSFTGPIAKAAESSGALPIVTEALETLEQIPLLIDEVADGARDFNPIPDRVKAAARRAYRARRTLVVQYTDDPIDESDEIEELLTAAQQIIRMKRPMVQIDVSRRNLPGGHAAPLIAPPLEIATRAEDILGDDVSKDRLLYSQAADTVEEITRWLEESNL